MLQTIFIYEWKQLLRSKGIVAAWIIFTAIGIFCLKQGRSFYQYQRIAVDSALAKKARNYEMVKNIFDTLTYISNKRNRIEEPWYLEWKLQDVVSKKISPLSILCIGQSDVYPALYSGHIGGEIFKNNLTEFKNPEQLLAGNPDTAFFVVFLFPFVFLALTYNLPSADKESGIFSLISAQAISVNKLMTQRLLFRWLIALSPVVIVALVSFFMLKSLPEFSLITFGKWWGVALLYAMCWFVIVAFVQRFQFSSLINAIILTGVWVLLLIAIPGLSNTWFNYKYPATIKTEIAEYRDFDFKAWDIPFKEHARYFFGLYPHLQKNSAKLDSNNIRSFSYTLQVFNKEKELHAALMDKAIKQMDAEEKSFWINPMGGIMRSFATLSQTSLRHQHQFEKNLMAYREKKLKYLFENQLLQPHFTKKDFEGVPKYEINETKVNYLPFLIPITLWMLIILLCILIKKISNGCIRSKMSYCFYISS